ncbi:hypothetical protein [Micromonospora psammae]|uniref:hypothetical protein n=1 Tax=Micromonospora sp. CPCC 205556 TaxID=3122398 RepID=UPI002FF26CF7
MHAHLRASRRSTGALFLLLPALLAACGDEEPETPAPTPASAAAPSGSDAARDELAALAAAARDRHLTARYTLAGSDGTTRDITVTTADDGSWRVDVPGGALGGGVDVSLAATRDGLFQCGLPSAARPEPATCVRLGDRDDSLPSRLDPRVHHPFTDWLEVLTDRRAALSVSVAVPPTGATGSCYAVETTSASLSPPLDVGIYCYERDGTPTFVRTALGTLTLAGVPGPGPATVPLAGPVVQAAPLGRDAVDPSGTDTAEPSGGPGAGTP